MERQEVYTLEQFGRDWPSSGKFTLGVGQHELLARSLPTATSIQTHAATFRRLIRAEGPVDVFGLDPELTLCYEKGWVHAIEVHHSLILTMQ